MRLTGHFSLLKPGLEREKGKTEEYFLFPTFLVADVGGTSPHRQSLPPPHSRS